MMCACVCGCVFYNDVWNLLLWEQHCLLSFYGDLSFWPFTFLSEPRPTYIRFTCFVLPDLLKYSQKKKRGGGLWFGSSSGMIARSRKSHLSPSVTICSFCVSMCGGCWAVTDSNSLSTPHGDAVITAAVLHWCVTADVARSIGPADRHHHSDCLLHFYYSYHSQAVAAVMTRHPMLLLPVSCAEITPEVCKPFHTCKHTHTLWSAHQHTETPIQAGSFCALFLGLWFASVLLCNLLLMCVHLHVNVFSSTQLHACFSPYSCVYMWIYFLFLHD